MADDWMDEGKVREALAVIEQSRISRRMSVREASGAAGIERSYWSVLVRGGRTEGGEFRAKQPRLGTVIAMARAVEVLDEVAELLGLAGETAVDLTMGSGKTSTAGRVLEERRRWLAEQRRKILALLGIPDADKLAALRVIEEAEAYQPPGDELYDDGWQPPDRPVGEEPGGE